MKKNGWEKMKTKFYTQLGLAEIKRLLSINLSHNNININNFNYHQLSSCSNCQFPEEYDQAFVQAIEPLAEFKKMQFVQNCCGNCPKSDFFKFSPKEAIKFKKKLTCSQIYLYLYLLMLDTSENDYLYNISPTEIAIDTGLTKPTVKRGFESLEQCGLISMSEFDYDCISIHFLLSHKRHDSKMDNGGYVIITKELLVKIKTKCISEMRFLLLLLLQSSGRLEKENDIINVYIKDLKNIYPDSYKYKFRTVINRASEKFASIVKTRKKSFMIKIKDICNGRNIIQTITQKHFNVLKEFVKDIRYFVKCRKNNCNVNIINPESQAYLNMINNPYIIPDFEWNDNLITNLSSIAATYNIRCTKIAIIEFITKKLPDRIIQNYIERNDDKIGAIIRLIAQNNFKSQK